MSWNSWLVAEMLGWFIFWATLWWGQEETLGSTKRLLWITYMLFWGKSIGRIVSSLMSCMRVFWMWGRSFMCDHDTFYINKIHFWFLSIMSQFFFLIKRICVLSMRSVHGLLDGMMLGKIQALKFINPKCKVHRCILGVSSAGSCVLSIGINYGGSS